MIFFLVTGWMILMDVLSSLGRSEGVCQTYRLKTTRCFLCLPIAGGENRRQGLTHLTQNGSRHPLRPSPMGRVSQRVHTEHCTQPLEPVCIYYAIHSCLIPIYFCTSLIISTNLIV